MDGFLLSVNVTRMPESLLRPVISESAKLLARADYTGIMALTAGMKMPRNKAWMVACLLGM